MFINVKADEQHMVDMLKLSNGVRKVPVIVEGKKVTVGYNGS